MTRINHLHISCSCRSIYDSPINRMLFWFNEIKEKDLQNKYKIAAQRSRMVNGGFFLVSSLSLYVVETFEFLLAYSKHITVHVTGTFFSKLHFAMHSMYAVREWALCITEHRLACSKCKQKPNLCDLLSCRHRYLGSSCTLCISISPVLLLLLLYSRCHRDERHIFQCIIMFVGVWMKRKHTDTHTQRHAKRLARCIQFKRSTSLGLIRFCSRAFYQMINNVNSQQFAIIR